MRNVSKEDRYNTDKLIQTTPKSDGQTACALSSGRICYRDERSPVTFASPLAHVLVHL